MAIRRWGGHRHQKRAGKGKRMTRQDAIDNLTSFGVENPTDDQITAYLNQVHGEASKERERAESYKKAVEEQRAKAADEAKKAASQASLALEEEVKKAAALQAEIESLKAAEAVRQIRDGVAKDTGVPAGLLTSNTEEECKAQAEAILQFARPGYPQLWDGGEVKNTAGAKSTEEQFAEFAKQALGG